MAKKTASKRARPKRLRCGRGYRFRKVGRTRMALMRGNRLGATVQCSCDLSGGCKITIDPQDPQTISCLESGCSGTCGWVISVPGLAGIRFRAVAARA